MKYIPIFFIAVSFIPASFIAHFFTGPSPDLLPWLVLGIPCAWILATCIGSISLLFTKKRTFRQRTLTLTISTVILFFPIRGLLIAIAEEITLKNRIKINYQSDLGISYMYGELSGMGTASGLTHWPSTLLSWIYSGICASLLWLPLAFLFTRCVVNISEEYGKKS